MISVILCLLQVMFPSACSFIVFWFSLSFTTCFGLHGHLQVCRILHIFLFIRLRDSASLLFWFTAFFSRGHTLHFFHLCFVPVLFSFVIFVASLRVCLSASDFDLVILRVVTNSSEVEFHRLFVEAIRLRL
jgi:hypothetical protein